mmetsp:Transcript_33018/g.102446  ORF Transcript_33018/g.102446 Transcript_33018/m.102446 type:complete len:216 (-) Transcript_33018:486-1133(-)
MPSGAIAQCSGLGCWPRRDAGSLGSLAACVVAIGALREEYYAPLRDVGEASLASASTPPAAFGARRRQRQGRCRGTSCTSRPRRAALLIFGICHCCCPPDNAPRPPQTGKVLPHGTVGQPPAWHRPGPADQQVSHGRRGQLARGAAHLPRALDRRGGGRGAREVSVLLPVLRAGGFWDEQGPVLLCWRPRQPASELGRGKQPRPGPRRARALVRG